MPDVKTRADSIRAYLSGAGSDGGTQTDPDASLGGNRSSTEAAALGISRTNAISNVTVDYASAANGEGDGTLTAETADTLTWTPPGGSKGNAVTIANGETKVLEGSDPDKYVRVSRTSTSDLSGTETDTLSYTKGNVISLDRVTGTEASNGDSEYRAFFYKNENSVDVENLKIFQDTLGTQATTDQAQLGATGSGTLEASTAGALSDWPDTGYALIKDSGGTIREKVYYESRTDEALTIPANGRAMFGTSAAAGAVDDTIDAVPGVAIAKEAPGSQPDGAIQTVADEDTAPTGVTWNNEITASGGLNIGTLSAGNIMGIWLWREVPAGAKSDPKILTRIRRQYEAA